MNENIIIYTDGSCDVNPCGNGGFSSIVFIDEKPIFLVGYEKNTTNQQMELKAAIQGLQYASSVQMLVKNVVLCTDSAYVCNCINQKWYKTWMTNGWKTSKGEPVANKKLWEELLSYIDSFDSMKFVKVKGHSDNIFNNKCDEMAKDIISFKKKIDYAIKSSQYKK